MAIENSQAPRRADQQARAGEENSHEANGQFAFLTGESRQTMMSIK